MERETSAAESAETVGPGQVTELVVPKARPAIPPEDIEALGKEFAEILASGRLTQGHHLDEFERQFAKTVGVGEAVGMNSGTAPMEVAMRYWGVQGRQVIVPTNTFFATPNAVILAGGEPVLTDVDASTLALGLAQVEAAVSDRTAGVIVVHIAGLIPREIEQIGAFCRRRGLFLLEDAAHAHGAKRQGVSAGALGDAASFSFYPTKVITCGEGGMLTTDDKDLAAFARSYRCHGIGADGQQQMALGANFRLPELSAVLGAVQLRRLGEFVAERNRLAATYRQHLAGSTKVTPFSVPAGDVHSYYKFPVLLHAGAERHRVVDRLTGHGVPAGSSYWPPCHRQPYYRARFNHDLGDFPIAEDVCYRTITLPLFVGMTEEQIQHVCGAVEREI